MDLIAIVQNLAISHRISSRLYDTIVVSVRFFGLRTHRYANPTI
jgi:hypothetical protein